jgi:hypothetical protein
MRPPGEKTKILVDFPRDEADKLTQMAHDTGIPRPTLLRLLFREFGDRMKILVSTTNEAPRSAEPQPASATA